MLIHFTSPRSFDTDGDGAMDFAEVELARLRPDLGFNPLVPVSVMANVQPASARRTDGYTNEYRLFDRDGDFLYDPFEEMMGWDTTTRDQNGNAIPDFIEWARGFDPTITVPLPGGLISI